MDVQSWVQWKTVSLLLSLDRSKSKVLVKIKQMSAEDCFKIENINISYTFLIYELIGEIMSSIVNESEYLYTVQSHKYWQTLLSSMVWTRVETASQVLEILPPSSLSKWQQLPYKKVDFIISIHIQWTSNKNCTKFP